LIGLDGASSHVHDPATHRRAFAVLCGRYGDVTRMAQTVSNRAPLIARPNARDAVDGTIAQARIDDLQRQLTAERAQVQASKSD
jgi:hypothetical protein